MVAEAFDQWFMQHEISKAREWEDEQEGRTTELKRQAKRQENSIVCVFSDWLHVKHNRPVLCVHLKV